MSRYLIVTWDGAGNLSPTLGIARTLVERGHDVRLLGHDTTADLCRDAGARFVALTQAEGWDAMEDPDDFEAEVKLMVEDLCFSRVIADDVARELDREPADVVLVDCMLFTAIDVALARAFRPRRCSTRRTRSSGAGLSWRCSRRASRSRTPTARSSACRRSSDSPTSTTRARRASWRCRRSSSRTCRMRANVLRIGPVLDAPPLCQDVDQVDVTRRVRRRWCWSASAPASRVRPTCCSDVSTRSAQLPVRAVVTTGPSIDPASVRAGANTQVVRYVPHAEVLGSASLVITHAGLGTTLAALADGVPHGLHADGPRPVLQRRAGRRHSAPAGC